MTYQELLDRLSDDVVTRLYRDGKPLRVWPFHTTKGRIALREEARAREAARGQCTRVHRNTRANHHERNLP